jgi:Fe-S oxidoreductase
MSYKKNIPDSIAPSPLQYELDQMMEKCKNCKLCQKECAFLQKYGRPKTIAENFDFANPTSPQMAFECSLCNLCTAVCPFDADPGAMFLEMRRFSSKNSTGQFKQHKRLLNFERRGSSQKYSHFALPPGCNTVLFPGCALSATRAGIVRELFTHLSKTYPNLGLVLDCCTKPSHDLGRQAHFLKMFNEIKKILLNNDIKTVLVACPSCYNVFENYGSPLKVKTVYEELAKQDQPTNCAVKGLKASFHDSCTARFAENMQDSVRKIARNTGIDLSEMKHHGKKALCCGEGGGACFIDPKLIENWKSERRTEMDDQLILTYCAGCANFIGPLDANHILDILFSKRVKKGKRPKVTRAPFTYWQRIRLKRWARKNIAPQIAPNMRA